MGEDSLPRLSQSLDSLKSANKETSEDAERFCASCHLWYLLNLNSVLILLRFHLKIELCLLLLRAFGVVMLK